MKFDSEFKSYLDNILKKNGFDLNDAALEKLKTYASELVLWNKKKNLTSITDPEEIAVLHFVDSVYISGFIEKKDGLSLLDVGTGGGFPGIPLKIVNPDLDITLLDSSGKKVSFLKYIIRELKLENIRAVNDRAEIYSRSNIEKFDYVVSRAFTSIESFFDMVWPCVKENGKILAMKGPDSDDEILKLRQSEYSSDNKVINGSNIGIDIAEYTLPVVNHKRKIISLTQ